MHKYWGKKPSEGLSKIVTKYTSVGDVILDPFAGFGGVAIESVLNNRNVIINDLNPVAVFISKTVLSPSFDKEKFEGLFKKVKMGYKEFSHHWYSYNEKEILTILRTQDDTPIKLCLKTPGKKGQEIISLTDEESQEFLKKENGCKIKTWFPKVNLIQNSRISAKKGMSVADLFPKRALICQSFLFDLINSLEDCPEKDLLLLSFTSNLANCSKLVPPIKSRGEMSQGAWMTGFYVGETYLENNVFHYFENRVGKSKKGKLDYLALRKERNVLPNTTVDILHEDAKNLSLSSKCIDFVFTDFPYGDTVPYFEQSQLWNAWLKNNVDYENEIVVSDSKERNKNITDFENGIDKSISEISRVIRDGKYFVFTFHSLYGKEWNAIVSALKRYDFQFVGCEVLIQKTLPPRQLNRANSIKGDIVAVYQKNGFSNKTVEFRESLERNIKKECRKKKNFVTNDLIVLCVKSMLESSHEILEKDFKQIIEDYFILNEATNEWRLK